MTQNQYTNIQHQSQTFNVLFCGTWENKHFQHSLIASIFSQLDPSNTIIFDGPGCGNIWPLKSNPIWAGLFGIGMKENIDLAIQAIPKNTKLLNIAGWSRGGYSALGLIGKLAKIRPEIICRAFIIEPVPGLGYSLLHRTINNYVENLTHANLQHIEFYFASEEQTPGFGLIFPPLPVNTSFSIHVFPANHNTIVGLDQSTTKFYLSTPPEPALDQITQIGKLMHYLLHKFFINSAVKLDPPQILNNELANAILRHEKQNILVNQQYLAKTIGTGHALLNSKPMQFILQFFGAMINRRQQFLRNLKEKYSKHFSKEL